MEIPLSILDTRETVTLSADLEYYSADWVVINSNTFDVDFVDGHNVYGNIGRGSDLAEAVDNWLEHEVGR